MGDVHDFTTGRIVKLCRHCHYWKDLDDFNFSAFGKYKRETKCRACSPSQLLAAPALPTADELNDNWVDRAKIIFEMEDDDNDKSTP